MRMNPIRAIVFFLVAAVCGCALMRTEGEYCLADRGNALADIVIASRADHNLRFAAYELKRHLEQVSGAGFEVVARSRPGRIALRVAYAPDLGDQETRIAFFDSCIALESGRYPEYAVWDFLHDYCGVRWLDPTDAGTIVPRKAKLSVHAENRRESPFFRGRDPGTWDGGRRFFAYSPQLWRADTPGWTNYLYTAYPSAFYGCTFSNAVEEIGRRQTLFLRRMKAGGDFVRTGHSFYEWYDRFWDRDSPSFERFRPELFAKGYEDERRPPQLCYSNPETVAQVVADVRAYFDKGLSHWGRDVYCLEPMDNARFCRCSECVSRYRPDLADSNSAQSDYWFGFVNNVAKEIAKSHPGKKISTLAYWSHAGVPSFRLEDNVIVHFCFTYNRMPYASIGHAHERRQMAEWREAYPDRPFGLWLYNAFPRDRPPGDTPFTCFPGFFARTLRDEYALFADLGISECVYNCGFVDDYENFLSLRWMWNPREPLSSLEEEYFSSYGAAADSIREFYRIVEERYCDPSSYVYDDSETGPQQTWRLAWECLGTSDVMRRLEELMADAERLADSPLAKARVANWKAGIWYYMLSGCLSYRSHLNVSEQ